MDHIPDFICKICYEQRDENMIISAVETSNTVLDKIASCFNINIRVDDSLPLSFCKICTTELDTACNIRNKCLRLYEKLRTVCYVKKDLLQESKYCDVIIRGNVTQTCKEMGLDTKGEEVKKSKEIFQCSLCNKTLKTKVSLTKHNLSMHLKRKHLGKVTGTGVNRRYHCTKCSYSTPHSQTLVNHMRRHNGDRPYNCECGKTFTQASSLAAHHKIHSNKTFYTCPVCGKQFKHAFSLKKHQFVHEKGKFVCNICNKQLKSHKSLQDHIHRHYNVRNYSCEECGNMFVTSSELHNHRKTHGLGKHVECHVCGYKTHSKKNIIIHLKRHSGDKSFKCDNCILLFYTSGDLKRHQRVHTKNKPYKCATCSQCFAHSPSLNKHMLSVHGILYKWADFKWKECQKNVTEGKE